MPSALPLALAYLFCAVASGGCTVLLLRAQSRSGAPILFWTGLSFIFLTINNLVVFADLAIFPDINLWFLRRMIALVAVGLLLFGLLLRLEP